MFNINNFHTETQRSQRKHGKMTIIVLPRLKSARQPLTQIFYSSIVIESSISVPLSAQTVNSNVPLIIGMPEIIPSSESSRPSGSELPLANCHVVGMSSAVEML